MENKIGEIFEFIDDGNFKRADAFCNELLPDNPENASLYVAKLMIEMQARNADQIKARLPMYVDSENYKKAVQYDDGQFGEILKYNKRKAKKYVRKKKKKGLAFLILLVFVAVVAAGYFYLMPSFNYSRAEKLFEEGQYKKAADVFESLGDYKDSRVQFETSVFEYSEDLYLGGNVTECLTELEKLGAGDSERVHKLRYDCAMWAMNNMAYIEAAAAFELLGDYQDSKHKMHNCYLYYACYLSDSGNREGALKILNDIGLGEDDIYDMKYDHGSFLFDHQMYYDAKLHYATLGDYRDCVMKIVYIDSVSGECMYTVTDNPDDETAAIGVYADYSEAFDNAVQNEGCHIYDENGLMFY